MRARCGGLIEIGIGEEQVESDGDFWPARETHAGMAPEAFDDAEGELDVNTTPLSNEQGVDEDARG